MTDQVPTREDTAIALVSAGDLRRVVVQILVALAVPPDDAQCQAEVLVEADLRGHPSHGVQRMQVLVGRLRRGLATPEAKPDLRWSAPAVLAVDGRRGLGPVVAFRALEAIADRAREQGIALAAIRNSNHLGMLSPYVEWAASRGMVALATTTSEALVHPWGGRTAMLGTNPLAVSVPAGDETPTLDMATGMISMGKVIAHELRGEPLPEGSAIDVDGRPTTDPAAARQGAISPYGGAKGYALAVSLELLVAALTATALGTQVKGTLDDTEVCNKGDVFICIDPHLAAGEVTDMRLSQFIKVLRNTPHSPGSGSVALPGDRARAARNRHLRDGVPVAAKVWAGLCARAQELAGADGTLTDSADHSDEG